MPLLRYLVLLASGLQIGVGVYLLLRFVAYQPSDTVGLGVCGGLVVIGIASIATLCVGARPSLSRTSTSKLNALGFAAIIGCCAWMIYTERQSGIEFHRLQFLLYAFGACALPFLVNGMALGALERRGRKLAM